MADHVSETPNRGIHDPKVRAWLYNIGVAILGVLAVYNLVEKEDVPVWVNLLGAVFGTGTVGLARANTPTK